MEASEAITRRERDLSSEAILWRVRAARWKAAAKVYRATTNRMASAYEARIAELEAQIRATLPSED